MNQAKCPRVAAALAATVCSPALFAQVFVNETFDYADQAALDVNWNLGANSPLSLNIGIGNPAPSANNPATGTNPNIWAGSTFSLIPTDVNPIRLTADITSDGTAGSVTTKGHVICHVKVLKPDGSIYGEREGMVATKNPIPSTTALLLASERLVVRIEPKDPAGIFVVEALVKDKIKNIDLKLKQSFSIEE